ncbi:hypothetical protein VCHA53O466_50337 [Vibrio chagasii]|nr:hypothetical protein VCHA53O466_50337 [Vibrio chagasii]
MTLKINTLEAKLLAILLEQLSDEQSNAGCNDFIIPDGVFSEDELELLNEEICAQFSPEEYDSVSQDLKAGSCVSDMNLTNIMIGRVDKYLNSL